MSAENPVNHQPVPYRDDDEIDLLDLLIVLAKNKLLILGAILIFTLSATWVVTRIHPSYKATASFFVLPAKTAAQQTINQELAANIAKSDQIIANVALRLNLVEVWSEPDVAKILSKIKSGLSTNAGTKTAPPSITMESNDPKAAADLVNAIIEETGKHVAILHEKEMKSAGAAMALVEEELSSAQKELGNAIKTFFGTVKNYDIPTEEKSALSDYRQFSYYEEDISALGKLPDGGAAYLEALRNIKVRETFFFSLAAQYGKVLEQLNAEPVTLHPLEKASTPALPFKPRKKLVVLMSGFLGGFIGIFGAFIREFARNAKRDPERKAKLEELSAAMRIFGKGKE